MALVIKWYLHLLSVYSLVCSVHMLECGAPPDIICTSTTDGGVECDFKSAGSSTELSPDRVTINGDLIVVGSTNHLFTFDVAESLRFESVLAHCPDTETRAKCLMANDGSQCYNYIRFVQPVPAEISMNNTRFTDKILACGTNAVSPKCTVHSRENMSEWFYLTDQEDAGFSPYLSDRPMVGLLGTNALFYTATVFAPYGSQRVIAIAPSPLEGSSRFSTETPPGNPYWLVNPSVEILSMYEMADHIYIFAREIAQFPELPEGQSTVYSRVMRICKNDQIELTAQSPREFVTFQKARMKCSSVRNTIDHPYDYNEIQSTYLVSRSSEESVLYATFSSSPNGPKGSAVCRFEFDPTVETSLTGVFETVEYFAPRNGIPTSSDWDKLEGAPFVCPGQAGGLQREPQEALDYKILMNGEAVPTGEYDTYKADGVVFTKIAVEILAYNGREYQIMFIGTDNGEIRQVVVVDDEETFEFRRASMRSGNDITYMELTKPNPATEIRKLYYANADFLSEITLGDCGKYTSCHECVESNDPYCAWQNGSTCVNILLQPVADQTTEALRGFSKVEEVCTNPVLPTQSTQSGSASVTQPGISSIRPRNTVLTDTLPASISCFTMGTTVLPATASTPAPPPPVDTRPSVNTEPVSDGVEPSSQNVPSIALIAGAVVGGLIIGIIIGVVVGCLGLATKRALLSDTKSGPSAAIENGVLYNHTHNGTSTTSLEPTKCNEVSSPTSSGSSQGLDIGLEELEDDAITDLPSNTTSLASIHKKNKGRTPSTRWLRASESEGNPP